MCSQSSRQKRRIMYRKIILVLLVSTIVLSTGCGTLKNDVESTKAPEVQSTKQEIQENNLDEQGIQELEKNIQETEAAEETTITITSIQVNKDTKSFCVEARFSTAENITEADYSVVGVQVLRTEVETVENGYDIRWFGFYEAEDVFQNIKIERPFEKEHMETVESEAGVEEVPAKKFDVQVGDSAVSVWVTPFALLISPSEDWREDGEFYNLFAIDTSKARHYICSLPMMDDRKPSQQKEDPLENPDVENLNELGDGLAFSLELEHCGVQSVFNEEIDLEQIEQVEILCYHKTEFYA